MADIAEAAGVSRQTLYTRFENKDGVVCATVSYLIDRKLEQVRREWETTEVLAVQLDIYFRHAVLAFHQMISSTPEAADLISMANSVAAESIADAEQRKVVLIREILAPYRANLERNQETLDSLADFVVSVSSELKLQAVSEKALTRRLETLKNLVLLVADG